MRPQPGAAATAKAAAALGLDPLVHPIFAVRPVAWEPVPRDTVDAVLLGSANAVRHGGEALALLQGVPAYCVGQTTAEAAEAAGFAVARTGSGGLQSVLDALDPAHRRVLRLAGAARVPLTAPAGVTMTTRVVYASVPLPMSDALRRALAQACVVLLHSGEAARHFASLCEQVGVDRSCIALAVIGPRVAPLCGPGWHALEIAAPPSDAALLALAGQMCQDTVGLSHSSPERPDARR